MAPDVWGLPGALRAMASGSFFAHDGQRLLLNSAGRHLQRPHVVSHGAVACQALVRCGLWADAPAGMAEAGWTREQGPAPPL